MSRILRSIAKDVKKNQQLEFQPRLLAITATKVGWTQIGELLAESPRFRDLRTWFFASFYRGVELLGTANP